MSEALSQAPVSSPQALLLTAPQCAEMCGVSESCWWRRDAAGLCPAAVRCGRTTRWRRADVELWVRLSCPGRKQFEAIRGLEGLP